MSAARRRGRARGIVVGALALLLIGLVAAGIVGWIHAQRLRAAAARPDFAHQVHMANLRALLVYYREHHDGRWPAGIEELARDPDYAPFAGIYGRDLYGHPFRIEMPAADGGDPRILSLGKDGKAGGEGEDADIEYAGKVALEWSEGAVPSVPDQSRAR